MTAHDREVPAHVDEKIDAADRISRNGTTISRT
jgi:hypothetical protein